MKTVYLDHDVSRPRPFWAGFFQKASCCYEKAVSSGLSLKGFSFVGDLNLTPVCLLSQNSFNVQRACPKAQIPRIIKNFIVIGSRTLMAVIVMNTLPYFDKFYVFMTIFVSFFVWFFHN